MSVGDRIRQAERDRLDRLDRLVRQGRLVIKVLRDLRATLAAGVGAAQVVAAVDLLAAEATLVEILAAAALETGADPAAVGQAQVERAGRVVVLAVVAQAEPAAVLEAAQVEPEAREVARVEVVPAEPVVQEEAPEAAAVERAGRVGRVGRVRAAVDEPTAAAEGRRGIR